MGISDEFLEKRGLHSEHAHIKHPFANLNSRLADKINVVFGSMTTFWILVCWQLGWMILAGLGVWFFKNDQYPFVFLLFLSNLIQLWALPILGSTTNRADQKRELKADADHQALTYIANSLDALRGIISTKEKKDAS